MSSTHSRALSFLPELAAKLPDHVIITDPDIISQYASDRTTSLPPQQPSIVVNAENADQVSRALHWANEHQIPVVPRGAGTSIAAGSQGINGGITISVHKMNRILALDADNMTITVEPGVITGDIDMAAAEHGLMYPPDPGSVHICSIGGNLATNAGGLRCVKYGVTRNFVRTITMVLANGQILKTGHLSVKGVAGYDLVNLIVGSEGTLGIIVEATLSLLPRPKGPVSTLFATFDSTRKAGSAVTTAMSKGLDPTLMEFMDRHTLRAIDEWKNAGLSDAVAAIVCQLRGEDAPQRAQTMSAIFTTAGAQDIAVSDDPQEGEQLIELRRLAYPAMERKGFTIVEDIGVPRSALAEMIEFIQESAKKWDVEIYSVGHAGDGNIHPVYVYHSDSAEDVPEAIWQSFDEILTKALSVGGTLSGEHGIGELKQRYLLRETGELSAELQHSIKAVFDPKGILNPGRGI